MKIGILTYHRAYNYGAFLQAFALKSFLAEKGYDVSFVDYWPLYHESLYSLWDKTSGLKSFFRNLILAFKRHARYKRFNSIQRHFLGLKHKPEFRSASEMEGLDYDVIVYGSDQIWWKSRIGKIDFDPVYWGQNISRDIKKVSYAASMGIINLTDADLSQIRKYLTAFSSISVRETQLMNTLQPLTEKTIKTALDPTLLMPSSFWESVCTRKTPVNGKYILYYKMMNDDKADVFAHELGKLYNLPVIRITGNIGSYKTDRINTITDPFLFLALIRNAEYVVSTSFHGVAMSIQFHKEFYAMGMSNNSNRVTSLLSQLGLEQRMTDSVQNCTSQRIDYSAVQIKLSELRQESANILISSILS